MNNKKAFDHLRLLAALKRDQEVKNAKVSYKATLARIGELERELSSIRPTATMPTEARLSSSVLIESVLPEDRPFTIKDVVRLLELADLERTPAVYIIRQHVRRMVKRGQLQEVKNANSRLEKRYAYPHVEADPPLPPLAEMAVTRCLGIRTPLCGLSRLLWRCLKTAGKRIATPRLPWANYCE